MHLAPGIIVGPRRTTEDHMPEQHDDDWHELWATFSVKDHCQPGAFIAEALLYDRLVLPVVPRP
jgi:hypothetical protein